MDKKYNIKKKERTKVYIYIEGLKSKVTYIYETKNIFKFLKNILKFLKQIYINLNGAGWDV